jgi:heme/copper-type cytochrome/quinol oxidase subunit 1
VPDAGWFAYTPLSGRKYGARDGLLAAGAEPGGDRRHHGGVEIVVTILKFRAPGMSLGRMPLFVWAMLVAGVMISSPSPRC